MNFTLMTMWLSQLRRLAIRAHDDDSGVAHEALIIAGLVAAALVIVGAVAVYVAGQMEALGG